MRRAQIVVYENDGRLTGLLRERATARGWWLREVHHAGACLRLLRRGAGVLVLKVGRDVEREMTLLERATRLCPDAVAVLVGDADNSALAGLAWDLGVRYVLVPPQPREHLPDIVTALMPPERSPADEGPAMTPELPVLNETLCTGCGDCVQICPTDCLAMDGRVPWLPRPAACVSCTLCVLVCPAKALEMASPDADEPDPVGQF